MSEKTLKSIFVVLGILVIVWLGSGLLSRRGGGGAALDDGGLASVSYTHLRAHET